MKSSIAPLLVVSACGSHLSPITTVSADVELAWLKACKGKAVVLRGDDLTRAVHRDRPQTRITCTLDEPDHYTELRLTFASGSRMFLDADVVLAGADLDGRSRHAFETLFAPMMPDASAARVVREGLMEPHGRCLYDEERLSACGQRIRSDYLDFSLTEMVPASR